MKIFTTTRPASNAERLANYRQKVSPLAGLSRQLQDALGAKVRRYYTWAPDGMLWPVPDIPVHRPPAGFDSRFRKYFVKGES